MQRSAGGFVFADSYQCNSPLFALKDILKYILYAGILNSTQILIILSSLIFE